MKFTDNTIKYLTGKEFSSGLIVPICKYNEKIFSREELIINIIKNKKVIHLGCCDHKPLIKSKIENNTWMHKIITENSKLCLGIDIDTDTIDYVKSEFKYNNIIYGDVTDCNKINEIESNKFDVLVMGEILEHIDNPVSFLSQIRENYINNISRIIITVPNAFSYKNKKAIYNNVEIINSDHRYWFTPYTLAKVAIQAGYKVSEFFFTDEIKNSIGLKAKIKVIPYLKRKKIYYNLNKYPALRENIIMTLDM